MTHDLAVDTLLTLAAWACVSASTTLSWRLLPHYIMWSHEGRSPQLYSAALCWWKCSLAIPSPHSFYALLFPLSQTRLIILFLSFRVLYDPMILLSDVDAPLHHTHTFQQIQIIINDLPGMLIYYDQRTWFVVHLGISTLFENRCWYLKRLQYKTVSTSLSLTKYRGTSLSKGIDQIIRKAQTRVLIHSPVNCCKMGHDGTTF